MSSGLGNFFFRLGRFSGYILAVCGGGLVTYLLFSSVFFSAIEPNATEPASFIVPKGGNLKTISEELQKQKFVKYWWAVYYPGLNRLKKNNQTIKTGEYTLSRSMTPLKILDKILEGDVLLYKVTIPEGLRLNEIADRVAQSGLVSKEEMYAATNDKSLLGELGIPSGSLEGYLFPETYQFSKPITGRDVLLEMGHENQKRITNDMVNRAIDLGFTVHQILTLASIIEKETGSPEERAKISSVFHNRLRVGMPLQSDPTVIYDIPDFDGNLTKEHLRRQSSYNTYMQPGLPPGPIASPGLAAVVASLHPEDTDYLYFVAKGDGTHQFSSTIKEHNEAVNRFQRNPATAAANAILDQVANEKPVEKPAPPPAPPVAPEAQPDNSAELDAKEKGSPLSQLDPVRDRGFPPRPRKPKVIE